MLALAEALAPMLEVVRFDFPYRERGSKLPDRMPVLMESISGKAKSFGQPCFLGGRSMGGRAASMLAAEGFPCAGLLLFAYPLHPAGKPDRLRDAHLRSIQVPVLCFNGTRDELCDRALMEKSVAGLKGWTQHWLEGARHSFADRKAMEEVARATAAWLRDCTDIQ
jgi:predicted alpha/beta-hydrolase family hydrolase